MTALYDETANWLGNLHDVHGWDGVVHEVAAVISESNHFSRANFRYRQTLAGVMNTLIAEYDSTGNVRLLDMARDVERLIKWSDAGEIPMQMSLMGMPSEEQP